MHKIDLGQAITILANLGVLVGILLLAYELNQNRQMMEAQTRREVAQGIVDQLSELASNRDLSDLEFRGRCETLDSREDARRFFIFINSRMRYWEDVHYQYRQGLYEESEFLPFREAWRAFIRPRAVRDNWNRIKAGFSSEFVKEIDALIFNTEDSQFEVPEECN